MVLARAAGPITHAYFCIATEALDDDGLPHTLEHLVFLGSEKYPYKGVLDMAVRVRAGSSCGCGAQQHIVRRGR